MPDSASDQNTIILDPVQDGSPIEGSFGGTTLVLGRIDAADFTIASPATSRRHAGIDRTEDGCWWIEDLGSRAGTQLNWMRLDANERARLRGGDRLRIGTVDFTVRFASADGPEDESPPDSLEETPEIQEDEYRTRGSLLLRLQAGATMERELSWETFYDRYVPLIKGFARRAGAGDEESDDVAQEVMANFFRAASRFEYDPGLGRFRGYLKACTLNAMRSRWRRKKDQVDVDASTGLAIEDEDHAEKEWEQEWIRSAIARSLEIVKCNSAMSDRSWEAFELYGRREVPIDEVAERLEMSPEAIRQAKSRISRLVRAEIERIRIEEG
ncbi:MAG: sigma-70 family RNA polymerase sigma factor [Phycisphaerales bacterium]|nr:sigma-70 family RNA polymerase sigma factor [Phycisphaerales bacterium]